MTTDFVSAVIGALGTIIAACLGVLTWYLATHADRVKEMSEREAERLREAEARDQRVLDIVVALHSEILAGLLANRRQLTPEEARYALAQDNPFATPDDTDFVFDSVKNDITILPAPVIHAVVQYYRVARQTNLITRDLRDPQFLSQSRPEKRKVIRTLLELLELQKMLGEAAVSDLANFAAAFGLDLAASERRAVDIVERSRRDLEEIFRQSERLGPSS
jgi:hypothetical protein